MKDISGRVTWATGLPDFPSGLVLLVLVAPACTPYDGQDPGYGDQERERAEQSVLDDAVRSLRVKNLLRPSPRPPVDETRQAAARGDPDAQYDLGRAYEIGIGVPQDEAQAVRLFQMAAEQGHALAQNRLGVRYFTGDGVPEVKAEGARWFRMAAEQGNVDAQYVLGVMYASGEGVPEDLVLAHMWFNISAAIESERRRDSLREGNSRGGRFRRSGAPLSVRSWGARVQIERSLTPEQVARAATMARTCMDSGYQDCGPE